MEKKYPQIAHCIHNTADIVNLIRRSPTMKTMELEARLGSYDTATNSFKAGISRQKMDDIIQSMHESSFITGDAEWSEEQDFFYKHQGRNLRTRVQFDSNNMEIISTTIEKKNIRHLDCITSYGDNDIRISLKNELPVTQSNIPTAVNPDFVRIKQRKRFRSENSKWAFDFTMSWSGRNKDEAELSQQTNEPLFELECELVDNTIFNEKTDEYIATSLLLKMMDFLPLKTVITKCVE